MLDFIACNLIKAVGFFVKRLPISFSLSAARFLGKTAFYLSPRKAQAYSNIKMAFQNRFSGKEIKRIIRSNYVNLIQNIVEILYFPKMNKEYSDQFVSEYRRELYDVCIQNRTHGVVFLTAHFGNWELLSQWGCFQGFPIYVVVRDQKLKKVDQYLTSLREVNGSTMIRKGAGIRKVLGVLKKENGLLGILGDQSGGKEGVPVRFFGKRTTAPQGVIEIAYRTGAMLQPSFLVREKGKHHKIYFEDPIPIEKTDDMDKDIEIHTQKYINILEKYITQFPDQWLWLFKRWKHSWTKKIVILSDGKAGHETQSSSVAEMLSELGETDKGFDFSTEIIQVRYKSSWSKFLFSLCAFFMMPWSQGRLHWLKPFLTQESYEQILKATPDFIISCGSSVLPINWMLKKECLAKNVVLMKSMFPYSFFQPDLNLIPEHDKVRESEKVILTRVAPNLVNQEEMKKEGEKLRAELNLDHEQVISLFLGGKTKGYDFKSSEFESLINSLNGFIQKNGCRLLITTSRRTEPEFEQLIKSKFKNHPKVPLMVIANESNPNGVVSKMMGASDVLLISEDSISMISEGVASGKDVIILKLNQKGLASKHYRFQKNLEKQGVLRVVGPSKLQSALEDEINHRRTRMIYDDKTKIAESLRQLL